MRNALVVSLLLAIAFCGSASAKPGRDPLSRVTVLDSSQVNIPWDTVRVGLKHLIRHVGEDFFDANQFELMAANRGRERNGQWQYQFQCRLRFAGLTDTDCLVQFFVSPDSTQASDFGLPRCADDPGACSVTIDRPAAIQIARDHGLEPGRADWRTTFSHQRPGFRWSVENTLHRRDGRYPASGRALVIDAVTGDVVQELEWVTE